jgi:predicted ArsR family transcriptional regulator
VCSAAAACTGLCRGELELFRTVLGPEVAVERTQHLMAGDARCVYQVRAVDRGA